MFVPASSPLSPIACAAAACANRQKRSLRLVSFMLMPYAAGSKSRTTPATFTGSPHSPNSGQALIPQRPASSADQKAAVPFPTGEMTPVPVITTLLSSIIYT